LFFNVLPSRPVQVIRLRRAPHGAYTNRCPA